MMDFKEGNVKICGTINDGTAHRHAYFIFYMRCNVSGKGGVKNVLKSQSDSPPPAQVQTPSLPVMQEYFSLSNHHQTADLSQVYRPHGTIPTRQHYSHSSPHAQQRQCGY